MPPIAPDITAEELDQDVRDELRSLPGELADLIARHLVAAERALGDDEPERAYEHAKVARRFAGRIGVVREAAGVTAYRAGQYAEALGDLRAARRMTGSDAYLPIMADCERGLGRPERALDLVRSPEAARLDRAGAIELAMVESGARRDLGQFDAAVVTLQRLPELRDTRPHPWSARLAFAYADALAEAGHAAAATDWFSRAMDFDEEGETDAAERYAELTGEVIEDVEEEFADGDAAEDGPSDGDDEPGKPLDDTAGFSGSDLDDELGDLEDEEEIDDLAVLDEQIEAEDDLEEDDLGEGAPGEEDYEDEPRESGEEPRERESRGGDDAARSGMAAPGVGPSFVEPDFGDGSGFDDEPGFRDGPNLDEEPDGKRGG